MKNLKLFLYALMLWFSIGTTAQLPYTWTTDVNPGWTNAGVLQWTPGCTVVTTNCTGNYSNNTNSTYTSPVINASCSNASTVTITFTATGNIEFGWDFLFIEYSLNGGTTWINPYGVGTGWTGNFGAGTTIPVVIASTSSNFRFRFRFQSDNSVVLTGYKITDFDIACNVVLPITLLSFDGIYKDDKSNVLTWITESERDNDYFTIERSVFVSDGTIVWHPITKILGAGNSTTTLNYIFQDYEYIKDNINYYRISQTDYDGKKEIFNDMLVVIDNHNKNKKNIIKIINLLGQEVKSDTPGVVFYIYEDTTIKRVFNI